MHTSALYTQCVHNAEPRSLLLSTNTHREPYNELMLICLSREAMPLKNPTEPRRMKMNLTVAAMGR